MERVLRQTLLCLGFIILAASSYGQLYNVQGNVRYHQNYLPLGGINAVLINSDGTVVANATTDAAGNYEFVNVPAGTYDITFATQIAAGGVTLTDAYLVLFHLYNMYPLDNFGKKIADVNGSGTVTYSDYNFMVYSYLNQGIPFPAGDWMFENVEGVVVPTSSRDGFISKGGSTGDVNGTYLPPKYGNCFVDEASAMTESFGPAETGVLKLESGLDIDITGMHLEFGIPSGLNVKSVRSSLPGLLVHNTGSLLRLTWLDEKLVSTRFEKGNTLVELEVESNSETVCGQEMHFNLDWNSHFIGWDGEMLPYVNLIFPKVKFEEHAPIAITQHNYPNPFTTQTHLAYELASPAKVRVTVTNSAGQVIALAVDEYQEAGAHQITLDASAWPEGIYHYAVEFDGNRNTMVKGSMIKSR